LWTDGTFRALGSRYDECDGFNECDEGCAAPDPGAMSLSVVRFVGWTFGLRAIALPRLLGDRAASSDSMNTVYSPSLGRCGNAIPEANNYLFFTIFRAIVSPFCYQTLVAGPIHAWWYQPGTPPCLLRCWRRHWGCVCAMRSVSRNGKCASPCQAPCQARRTRSLADPLARDITSPAAGQNEHIGASSLQNPDHSNSSTSVLVSVSGSILILHTGNCTLEVWRSTSPSWDGFGFCSRLMDLRDRSSHTDSGSLWSSVGSAQLFVLLTGEFLVPFSHEESIYLPYMLMIRPCFYQGPFFVSDSWLWWPFVSNYWPCFLLAVSDLHEPRLYWPFVSDPTFYFDIPCWSWHTSSSSLYLTSARSTLLAPITF